MAEIVGESSDSHSPPVEDADNVNNLKGAVTGESDGLRGDGASKKKSNFMERFKSKKDGDGEDEDAEEKVEPIGMFKLFRFADRIDVLCMVIGALMSMIHGASTPIFTIVFGDVINTLGDSNSATISPEQALQAIKDSSIWFVILGVIAFVSSLFQVLLFLISGARQAQRIRKLYIESVFRQEMGWYDSMDTGVLTSRVAGDVDIIFNGIGDKVGSFIQFFAMFVVGFVIGFVYGWLLTFVILSVVPLLVISGGLFAKVSASATAQGQEAYARAGGIAEEVLSLIRTVVAFGGEEREIERFEGELEGAYKVGVRRAHVQGLGMGVTFFFIFSSYSLGFWFGNKMVQEGRMSPGDVLTVFFSVVIGAMGLGQATPAVNAFSQARGAAPKVFEIIDRKPEIDNFSMEGEVLDSENVRGDIEFRDVDFTYSSRQDELILDKMSLSVEKGQTLALVGPSGCGKSTTIQLVERFYEAIGGSVLLDGNDVRTINVQSLRAQIGLVSQMPTLFAASIRENIELGAGFEIATDDNGEKYFKRREVTFEQVQTAAKQANAHDFISKLPEGYDTMLGQRGALLSGGQKQRVAIARALIRNPRILLLDEATSALDSKSERVVQEALETAAKGRTTIVIAHRLSTIRNADKIAVVEKGRVVEIGSHDELVKIEGGKYKASVELQKLLQEEEREKGAAEEEEVADPDDVDAVKLAEEYHHSRGNDTSEHGRHHHEHKSTTVHSDTVAGGELGAGEEEEEGDPVDKGVSMRALKMNSGEWLTLTVGLIGAAANGATFPVFSLVFAEIVVVLTESDNNSEVSFWAWMFFVIGVASLLANYLQSVMFGISGEHLTLKVRSLSFRALMRQEIGFFDHKDNSVGALSSALSTDAAQVKSLAGDSLGIACATAASIITGVVIAFASCWKLAFVVMVFVPIMGVGQFLQMKLMSGFASDSGKMFAKAGRIASEAVDNIRTVTSLGLGRHFHGLYREELKGPAKQARKSAYVSSIAFGFSEFCMFAIWAVSFYYGAVLIEDGECDFLGVMKAITGLLFSAMSLGQISALAPNFSVAKVAATKVFRLLDREPEIDAFDPSGAKLDAVNGDLVFDQLKFEYPTRKEVPVLRKLSTSITAGKTLALVGESGCGKSTLVGLVERFYNLSGGMITLDKTDLASMNIRWLRSQIGIVSQEPDLFNTTVRENILYGVSREAAASMPEQQLVEAAKMANAEQFIRELPQGFDTEVGERGGKLSGGQRQRVAIARALIRNPKILLLDEATSALDGKSEQVVQEALNRAAEGRTTIVIAHRLATIQNADKIAVVSAGRVSEEGTHLDLMARKGAYATLVENQSS